jgi:hypothetical protein
MEQGPKTRERLNQTYKVRKQVGAQEFFELPIRGSFYSLVHAAPSLDNALSDEIVSLLPDLSYADTQTSKIRL